MFLDAKAPKAAVPKVPELLPEVLDTPWLEVSYGRKIEILSQLNMRRLKLLKQRYVKILLRFVEIIYDGKNHTVLSDFCHLTVFPFFFTGSLVFFQRKTCSASRNSFLVLEPTFFVDVISNKNWSS